MATNITVADILNYPDSSKTVVVDLKRYVLTGASGDEEWVASVTTTATASGSADIQDFYVNKFARGWSKSAGYSQGPFTINASQNTMKVSINGSAYRSITLTSQASAVTGAAVAADMQDKIRALSLTGAAEAGNLAFKNAEVLFEDGIFKILSGSTTSAYTGSNRSSVRVAVGDTNDVAAHLGFFAATESEVVAGTTVSETYLTYGYVAVSGSTYVDVSDQSIVAAKDCIGITDGSNTEYRYVSSVVAGKINFNAALDNNYAANSRVQKVRMQDPESKPASYFESVDDCIRYAIGSVVNQINFA